MIEYGYKRLDGRGIVIRLFWKMAIVFFFVNLIFHLSNHYYDNVLLEERLLKTEVEKEYKAITYNIHRGTTKNGIPSLDQIAQILRDENPDFIALQEVDRYHMRSGFQDQIKWLGGQLGMYHLFGTNINDGLTEYGNGILSKYPILEWGQVELANEIEPRSLLWAKVKTEDGDLYLTSIHLGLDTKKRDEHFNKINSFSSNIDRPILIMGDFNTLPDHQSFSHFRSMISGKLFYQEIPTYVTSSRPVQIDYIFGRHIKELNSYSIPSNASDHYPFVLTFKLMNANLEINE